MLLALLDLAAMTSDPGVFLDWEEEGVRNPLGVSALGGVASVLEQVAIALTFVLLLTAPSSGRRPLRRAQGRRASAAAMDRHRRHRDRPHLGVVDRRLHRPGRACRRHLLGGRDALDRVDSDRRRDRGAPVPALRDRPGDLADARLRGASRSCWRRVRRARARGPGALLVVRGRLESRDRRLDAASSPRCSCPCARACSGSSTAASTAAATTRNARSRGSARGCASRSTSATLERDLHGVVTETMQPAHASVWLRTGDGREATLDVVARLGALGHFVVAATATVIVGLATAPRRGGRIVDRRHRHRRSRSRRSRRSARSSRRGCPGTPSGGCSS